MILPQVNNPDRLQGLYVYDFGDWTSVGYTAEEVAILLDHERYRGGRVYKIHRATPGGEMELQGISAERFNLESGMFFCRKELAPARQDYQALRIAGETAPLPCRASLQLADRLTDGPQRFLTALIFPAEYEAEIGRWLNAAAFAGGDLAEGGISHVADYCREHKALLEQRQLWSRPTTPSRTADEVLASVRRAVQR